MKGINSRKRWTIRLADDIPMPEPGPYEALVKIESCMICNGTDNGNYSGELPEAQVFPTVLGHESAGRVVKIGEKVKAYKIGDMVVRASLPSTDKYASLGRIF